MKLGLMVFLSFSFSLGLHASAELNLPDLIAKKTSLEQQLAVAQRASVKAIKECDEVSFKSSNARVGTDPVTKEVLFSDLNSAAARRNEAVELVKKLEEEIVSVEKLISLAKAEPLDSMEKPKPKSEPANFLSNGYGLGLAFGAVLFAGFLYYCVAGVKIKSTTQIQR